MKKLIFKYLAILAFVTFVTAELFSQNVFIGQAEFVSEKSLDATTGVWGDWSPWKSSDRSLIAIHFGDDSLVNRVVIHVADEHFTFYVTKISAPEGDEPDIKYPFNGIDALGEPFTGYIRKFKQDGTVVRHLGLFDDKSALIYQFHFIKD